MHITSSSIKQELTTARAKARASKLNRFAAIVALSAIAAFYGAHIVFFIINA